MARSSLRQLLFQALVWNVVTYNVQAATKYRNFASISWQRLDQVSREVSRDNISIGFLRNRHKKALVLVGTRSNQESMVKTTVGDLQGDRVFGKGSNKIMHDFFTAQTNARDTVFDPSANHLGARHDILGNNILEVQARQQNATTVCLSMGTVWKNRSVPLKLKMFAFKQIARSTLTAGLEATVLTPRQIQRPDTQQLRYFRVIVGPITYEPIETGILDILSLHLRSSSDAPTICSFRAKRAGQYLQDHQLVFAASFG